MTGDPVPDAIAAALADEDPGVMVSGYVLAAEIIYPDGTSGVIEMCSEVLPIYAAYGLAVALAATFAPQPGWTRKE